MGKVQGFDYGTKPTVAVIGDIGFPELLRRGLAGLGYSLLPQHGLLVNPPLLVMIFEDADTARECFTRFRGWCQDAPDGDAVGTTFIEYDSGEYGFCVYQEPRLLVQRLVPEPERSEFEQLMMVTAHLKLFPSQSPHYSWFKSAVRDRMFVLAPGTKDGELILDLALRKGQVHFYAQDQIPEESIASTFARLEGEAGPPLPRPVSSEMKLRPRNIAERRRAQLSRFFPVTLERLAFQPSFDELKSQLKAEGYREWQVVQAACNVLLRRRKPELFRTVGTPASGQLEPQPSPLEYLLHNSEDLSAPKPAEGALSASALRRQIHADMRHLLGYVGATDFLKTRHSRKQLQMELERRELLAEGWASS